MTFVDLDTTWIRKNTRGISASYSILKKDCMSFLRSQKLDFDIVFFDPPWFDHELYQAVVPHILDALSESTIFIVEYKKKSDVGDLLSSLQSVDYHYGDTSLSVFRR